MENSEYRQYAYTMLKCINEYTSGMDPQKYTPVKMTPDEISALLQIAKKHSLRAITYSALTAAGLNDPDEDQICAKALRKSILLDKELQLISDQLTQQQICHMPLKGVHLKALYPKPWMREMSDIDILIEKGSHEAVRDLMLQNGYEIRYYGKNNEDVYQKKKYFLIEMHRSLFNSDDFPDIQAYFERQEYGKSEHNPCLWQMSPTEAYIYLIAHLYMHYRASGTGLRSLLDIRLYLQRYQQEIDFSAVAHETAQFGAAEFEKRVRRLSGRFLTPDALSAEERKELDYYIFSGTYGNKRQYLHNRIAESAQSNSGRHSYKLHYLRSRLAVPEKELKKSPFYMKHPRLRPLLGAARAAKAAVKKPKAILTELKELRKAKQPPQS